MPNLLSIERVCLFGVIFKGFSADGRIPDADQQDQLRSEPITPQRAPGSSSAGPGSSSKAIFGSIHPDSEIRKALASRPGLEPGLARIYAMSYEGAYTMLPRPTVFLVHGPGADPELLSLPGGPGIELAGGHPGISGETTTGLANTVGVFAQDIRVWVYDRDDMTVRVDIATGPLDELLIKPVYCPGGVGASQCPGGGGASRDDLSSRGDVWMRHRFR